MSFTHQSYSFLHVVLSVISKGSFFGDLCRNLAVSYCFLVSGISSHPDMIAMCVLASSGIGSICIVLDAIDSSLIFLLRMCLHSGVEYLRPILAELYQRSSFLYVLVLVRVLDQS